MECNIIFQRMVSLFEKFRQVQLKTSKNFQLSIVCFHTFVPRYYSRCTVVFLCTKVHHMSAQSYIEYIIILHVCGGTVHVHIHVHVLLSIIN